MALMPLGRICPTRRCERRQSRSVDMSNLLMVAKKVADEVGDDGIVTAVATPPKSKLKLPNQKPKPAAVPQANALAKYTDSVVHSVQSFTKEQALTRLTDLVDVQLQTAFELGGVLSRIREENWHPGGFYEWLNENTGIKRDNARGLMRVYEVIVELGEAGEALKAIDRTRVRAIASVITKENVAFWVERAVSAKSRAKLEGWVRAAKMTAEKADQSSATLGNANSEMQPKAVVKAIKSLQKMAADELMQTIASALGGLDAGVRKQVYQMIGAKIGESEAELD